MARSDAGPVRVVDPADRRLDDYRQLRDAALRRRYEDGHGVFLVEGRVAVGRLVASSYEVVSMLLDEHQVRAVGGLVDAVLALGAPVYVASRQLVESTAGFALHRGVVASARRPPAGDWRRLVGEARAGRRRAPPLLAVAEGLNDHENLGALFRNAAAFGVSGLLLDPTAADPLYRRAVRVSAGHVLSVPFARLLPWPAGLAALKRAGFVLGALVPASPPAERAGRRLEPDLRRGALDRLAACGEGVALLVGAEGPGLTPAAVAAADEVVSIAMAPGVDSLNVATAAAIAFYHLSTAWTAGGAAGTGRPFEKGPNGGSR